MRADMNTQPASYALHGCGPTAAYLRACLRSMQSAGRVGIGAVWSHNQSEALRAAGELIGKGA